MLLWGRGLRRCEGVLGVGGLVTVSVSWEKIEFGFIATKMVPKDEGWPNFWKVFKILSGGNDRFGL